MIRRVNNNQKMSTFEQFRTSHLKGNKSNSKESFRSFEQSIRHAGTITFSTKQIKFKIDEKQGIKFNKDLNITNQTGLKVYVKIRCSNPEYFDVRPAQDILESNWTTNIIFSFNQEKARNALKYRESNKNLSISILLKNSYFQFSWGEINEQNIKRNKMPELINKQYLTITFEQIQPPSYLNQLKAQKSKNEEQQMILSNNRSDKKISNNEGSQFSITNQQSTDMSSLLTLPIIIGVSFLSFVLGYCSG